MPFLHGNEENDFNKCLEFTYILQIGMLIYEIYTEYL